MVVVNRETLDALANKVIGLRKVVLTSEQKLDQHLDWSAVDRAVAFTNTSCLPGFRGRPQSDHQVGVYRVDVHVDGSVELIKVDEHFQYSGGDENVSVCTLNQGVWYLT